MQNVCKRSKSAIFRPEGDSSMIPGGQDPLQQNFAETLPAEMSVRIFSELDFRSLCRASLTCRQWNDIIEGSDHLWRSHCLTVLAVCRREVNGDRLDGCSWKVALVRNYRKGCVKRRWLKGRYSNIRSADNIPPNSMCPLDVETWGEILEAELER
ncbi:F-box only protein 48 [Anabarilius grahami]|uniref:F-box only protein 48 n=1 Tax=Anabarilius grahami TaxID=495550 RepID=A0A3N0YKZ0_ANAGA|nr:F-box only protein 48 [Anabarilius grahami]